MEENPETDRDSVEDSWNAEQILPFFRNAGPLSAALFEHVEAVLRSNDYARAGRLERDSRRIVEASMKAAVATLAADGEADEAYAELRRSADHWAREGVPVMSVIGGVFEGFRIASRVLIDIGGEHGASDLAGIIETLIDLLGAVTETIGAAYVEEYRTAQRSQRIAEQAAVTALVGGHPVSSTARLSGISVAESYTLLALAIGSQDVPSSEGPERDYVLRRTQRRVQAVLDEIEDDDVMSLVGLYGGIVLIPGTRSFEELQLIIDRMTAEARVDIVAAFVEARTEDLPRAVAQAHELIDVAQRLERPPGLYRFRDLALAFQLMQPGPGRDHLVEVLEPLRPHPELRHTLRVHIQNDLHRQRSARQLHLHANSLDNRLKRIGELTGLSVTKPQDLATLHAALIVSGLTPTSDL